MTVSQQQDSTNNDNLSDDLIAYLNSLPAPQTPLDSFGVQLLRLPLLLKYMISDSQMGSAKCNSIVSKSLPVPWQINTDTLPILRAL
jgi:hypothetical protein